MTVCVLHVLPHRGGGAETFIDTLEGMPGYRHERVALSQSRRPLAAGPSILAGYRRLAARARRADLIHAHGDMAAVLSLALMLQTKAVWNSHGLHFLRRSLGMRRRLFAMGLRAVMTRSAWTICSSTSEHAELSEVASARAVHRLVVVDNAVREPEPPPPSVLDALRRSLDVGADELSVLFVGQLEPRKGVLDAVEAVRLARRRHAGMVLLVAGEGPLADTVAAAGEGIRLLGHRADLEPLYAVADVFLMPSEREGQSFAVMESMVRGLPTVVSDAPGNREAVEGAGVLVPYGDPGALAEVLVRLARDPDERARLGAAARARAQSRFTLARFQSRMAELYEAALTHPQGA